MANNWTSADIERLKNRKQQAPGATGQRRFQALGRLKAGTMNKTEAAYANLLEARKHTGEIIWYSFEPINIRLAKNTFYKVDFLVMTHEGYLEAHEVKGFWTDDARVKIKIAAEKLPVFKFVAARLEKGQWIYEQF